MAMDNFGMDSEGLSRRREKQIPQWKWIHSGTRNPLGQVLAVYLARMLTLAIGLVLWAAVWFYFPKSYQTVIDWFGFGSWNWLVLLMLVELFVCIAFWSIYKLMDDLGIIRSVWLLLAFLVILLAPFCTVYRQEFLARLLGSSGLQQPSGANTTEGKQLSVRVSPGVVATQGPSVHPHIVQAVIQEGGTSLNLGVGRLYIYALVTGGAFPTLPFESGDATQATNAAGMMCAALSYGTNSQNKYETQTEAHVIGGVSVGGMWVTMKAYYGLNTQAGASSVSAPFLVSEDSLVVVIATAASEKQAALYGIQGLEIDASSSNGLLPMVVGHAYLPPGSYTASETSSAVVGQEPSHMADLIGVFVFEGQH
jgi:hypothetical protein